MWERIIRTNRISEITGKSKKPILEMKVERDWIHVLLT